jgi:hypothetical protein
MRIFQSAFLTVFVFSLAMPAQGQSLPSGVLGSWDISAEGCRTPGISMTQIDVTVDKIEMYAGNAIVRTVDRSGQVSFVAADFLQTEGAVALGERERSYFRFTQRDGADRLNFVWKDVQTVDLVRCDDINAGFEEAIAERNSAEIVSHFDRILPIPTGLWVVAGNDCDRPANASWRSYDGQGLYGARSRRCRIDSVSSEGSRYVIEQICSATYDGSETKHRDTIDIQAPKRFGLIEDGELTTQDFNWCGPRLRP